MVEHNVQHIIFLSRLSRATVFTVCSSQGPVCPLSNAVKCTKNVLQLVCGLILPVLLLVCEPAKKESEIIQVEGKPII